MLKNKFTRFAALASVMTLAASVPAHAALDSGITSAITAYQTDSLAVIALLLGAGVAIWGARKLGHKMGWL